MEKNEDSSFDSSQYPGARLFGHILTKGLQVGSVLGVSVLLPIAYLTSSKLTTESAHRLTVYGVASGVTLSGVLGIVKMQGMDRERMEDRVYRLHYNQAQNRLDRMSTIFGLFGAGVGTIGLMVGPDPYSIIAGFSMGTAAAVLAHSLTTPQKTDIGKIVHELKY